MSKILVVGSLIVDVSAHTPHFPVVGETALGTSLKFGPGGKGNNQATAAARAGGEVYMISKTGKDFLQKIMTDHYKNENMSMKYIYEDENVGTGSALIEVDDNGDNRIVVIKDANDKLTAAEVDNAEEDFKDCDVLIMQLETSEESILEGKKLAQKYGVPIILNPAPFQKTPEGLFDGIDYLTPNETEAEFFTGIPVVDENDAEKAAAKLHDMGVKNVIITLGKKGVYYSGEDGYKVLVPTTDLKSVDSTGAGDAFNGGFAVAVAEKMPVDTALKFANCVASMSVTRPGSGPSMPKREEVLELLERFYKIKL